MMPQNQPMTKTKVFLLIILLFIGLTGLRIGWIMFHKTPEQPYVEKGVLDLRDWTFTDKHTVALDGEWEFYPNVFIDPNGKVNQLDKHSYIKVPGNWKDSINSPDKSNIGHGTYRLKITLPDDRKRLYGLRVEGITNAAQIYVNGEKVTDYGTPGTSANTSIGNRGPKLTFLNPNQDEIEIMIHVSNYDISYRGGMTGSIKIGTETAIIKEDHRSQNYQLAVFIVYLLHSVYAFVLFFLARKYNQKELLFYGLMLLLAGFTVLIDDDIVLQLSIGAKTYHKLLNLLFISTLITLITAIKYLFNIKTRLFPVLISLYVVLAISIIFIPLDYFQWINIGTMILFFTSFYYLFSQTIKIIQKGNDEGIYVLFFITGYTSNMIWGAMINGGLVKIPFYPFDFIIYVVAIALLLLKRYMNVLQVNEQQTLALKEADRKKDEFLANTSHELRNPLHGIINIAQTMLHNNEDTLTQKNKDDLKLLIRISENMRFTLNDISDLTKIEENQMQFYQQPVNLHTVTSVVLDLISFMVDEKDLKFHFNIPIDFPKVYADENRLIQILFNLIHNAVKYTPAGSITIDARSEGNMATIYIKDTGIGIGPDALHNIFKPYEQEDSSMTAIGGGIGLGLHVCKQLVELHGGNLSVKSKPNEGSTFSFTLPLADQSMTHQTDETEETLVTKEHAATITEEPISEQKKKHKIARILIVDDDPVNLRVVSNILNHDYHLMTATSGQEALQYLKDNRFDLIISDVMMPQMSGYELTQHIRKQYTLSELPILLLTARNQIEDIQTGFNVGANDYVVKPVDALELSARVHSLIHLKLAIHEQLRMEAAWLQAQIRPHFLFNTLNTIASLSEIDTARMTTLLNHFGNYLRRSFNVRNTEKLIPLEEELEIVRSYVYIEQQRFGDRLTVEWDIDDDLKIDVPPLSIQPLVENAIQHGVLKRAAGGTVKISATEKEDEVTISIHDDGVGIDAAKVEKLLTDKASSKSGIGIANTNERLKKLFGKGLEIESTPNKGTTILFDVPKQ
ncbi:sensor histidine kinase YesM [Cerasibacillus quisquiliarum]|nr:ATP-binding protein [Cerasibacillus quisquiliarum]MBB5146174.1 sensor histidine kinase YesM [Cerasibacillus quisquiliarum]